MVFHNFDAFLFLQSLILGHKPLKYVLPARILKQFRLLGNEKEPKYFTVGNSWNNVAGSLPELKVDVFNRCQIIMKNWEVFLVYSSAYFGILLCAQVQYVSLFMFSGMQKLFKTPLLVAILSCGRSKIASQQNLRGPVEQVLWL